MNTIFFQYQKYALVFNLTISLVILVTHRFICLIYTSDPIVIEQLSTCLITLGIYLIVFQMRVFVTTYLRSNGIKTFNLLVSGVLYPVLILITLAITYYKKMFNVKALLWSFIFSDLLINYLLYFKALFVANKNKLIVEQNKTQ